jgi:hypothetical protein
VVVGEVAVHLAEQLDHLAAQAAEEFGGDAAGDAVAAIDDDLHRPRQLHVADDALDVVGAHIRRAQRAGAVGEIVLGDASAQALDHVAVERLAAEHHLEAVVIGRVMAAGHRHAGVAAELVRGEVGERRGHAADVDDVDAGGADAVGERAGERRAGQATVAPDRNAVCPRATASLPSAWPIARTASGVSTVSTMPRMS